MQRDASGGRACSPPAAPAGAWILLAVRWKKGNPVAPFRCRSRLDLRRQCPRYVARWRCLTVRLLLGQGA